MPSAAQRGGPRGQRRDLVGAGRLGGAGPYAWPPWVKTPITSSPGARAAAAISPASSGGRAGPAIAGVELEHDPERPPRAGDGGREALGARDRVEADREAERVAIVQRCAGGRPSVRPPRSGRR